MRAASLSTGAPIAGPLASRRLLALAGDERLVEQVRRGNDAAFEVTFERHSPAILGFCRHMLGSPHEAEDATQQTFASAHRALQSEPEREIALKPWLFTIARNRCLSMLRARREETVDQVEQATVGLAEQVEQRAELRSLLADLRELPEEQRAALLLTEVGDLSHADVARVLGCQVARVKALVFRARGGLIQRREARETPCERIQEQLANLRGGALRRTELRLHLRDCPGCRAYRRQVKQQRRMLGAALPVAPTVGLKPSVLAAVGIGGAAGGGAAAGLTSIGGAFGGAFVGGTLAKVALVGALVGGGAAAGEAVIDASRDPGPSSRPAAVGPASAPPRAAARHVGREQADPATRVVKGTARRAAPGSADRSAKRAGGSAERAGGSAERAGGSVDRAGGRAEKGGGRAEKGGGRAEKGGGRAEKGGGRAEKGGGRAGKGGGRAERGSGSAERAERGGGSGGKAGGGRAEKGRGRAERGGSAENAGGGRAAQRGGRAAQGGGRVAKGGRRLGHRRASREKAPTAGAPGAPGARRPSAPKPGAAKPHGEPPPKAKAAGPPAAPRANASALAVPQPKPNGNPQAKTKP